MAPKRVNTNVRTFVLICSNGLAMVDYSIYFPNDDNRRHSLAQNETLTSDYYILLVSANILSCIFSRLWSNSLKINI